MPTPRLLIVAGSNGAGKSTFAVPYAAQQGLPFLNADVLTREVAARGEEQALVKAARLFLRKLNDAVDARESVCFETTLSGRYVESVVQRARAAGYRIELVFIFVASADIAVQRVAGRVKKGGHDVPEEDVRRRFQRTLINFESLKREADVYRLFYSSSRGIALVRTYEEGRLRIIDQELSQRYEALQQQS